MFDLEKAIAEWRQQMLAAGIKSPTPLEELECHLREEIERQIHLGLNAQAAFDLATQKIGQAGLLKIEFKKTGGFSKWLGGNETALTHRVLGLLWLVICADGFFLLSRGFLQRIQEGNLSVMPRTFSFLLLVLDFIYLRGAMASILLFKGDLRERRFLRFIGILFAVGGIGAIIKEHASPLTLLFTVLGLGSIWLLRPPQKKELANK
jgi:hypothetical protein